VSLLRGEKLAVSFGDADILKGVSLAVEAGEMVGLVGPNGAGKTTLLKVLAQLLQAQHGEVYWNDSPLSGLDERERSRALAYLAQGAPAHWPLRVDKVVELGRIPHRGWWQGLSAADTTAIEQAMVDAEVMHLRERLVTTLSGGERTRALLARVFATCPQLILADEPVASLDPYHQLHVMSLLQGHAQAGGGVLVVLHDLNLAARFCDRLVLLDEGQVRAQGTPADVLKDPALAEAFGVSVELVQDQSGIWVHLASV
jgi:ABC-type cobalamin/Fe3+-siderophores transport system ATPase subunit